MQLDRFLTDRNISMVAFYDLCGECSDVPLKPRQNKSQKIEKYRNGDHFPPPEWIHLIEVTTRKIVADEMGVKPDKTPPDSYVRAQDWVEQHRKVAAEQDAA